MTRSVLVSHRLPELQSGNPVLDHWVREHLQAWISQAFEQLSYLTPEVGDWTAIVQGSGTAGTYEITTQESQYCRIGDWVFVSTYITLAGALTGGGAGDLNIAGLPYEKRADHNPIGTAAFGGVNWTAGANLTSNFTTDGESSALKFVETNDNAAVSIVPIGGIAVSDLLLATICYLTNGERSA